jgi:hypothetical protein
MHKEVLSPQAFNLQRTSVFYVVMFATEQDYHRE